jgi:hypothetical protein
LCVHRALSDREIEALPEYFWRDRPTDLAGGPVEVLWETEQGSASTRPCHHPERIPLEPNGDPRLWLPGDCGRCAPCVARAALVAERSHPKPQREAPA